MPYSVFVRDYCRVGAFEQPPYFVNHAFLESGVKAAVNPFISDIPAYQGTYIVCFLWKTGRSDNGMFRFINGYLQGSYESFARVVVRGVVKRLQAGEPCHKVFRAFFFEFFPELWIGRDFRKRVASCCSLDVQPGTSAEKGDVAPFTDFLICFFEVSLIFENIVFAPGIRNVNQVIWNLPIFV